MSEPIRYAQVRPMPILDRRWWRYMDCSSSPLARRIFTFMEWYDARGGKA